MSKKAKSKKKEELKSINVPVSKTEILNFFIKGLVANDENNINSVLHESYHDPIQKKYSIKLHADDGDWFYDFEEEFILSKFIDGWNLPHDTIEDWKYLFDMEKQVYLFKLQLKEKEKQIVKTKRVNKNLN